MTVTIPLEPPTMRLTLHPYRCCGGDGPRLDRPQAHPYTTAFRKQIGSALTSVLASAARAAWAGSHMNDEVFPWRAAAS